MHNKYNISTLKKSCVVHVYTYHDIDIVSKACVQMHILPQHLANQTKPTAHIERYGLTAVVSILTALLLSSLNGLQLFFVFLYALLEFSCAKHYR